MANKKTPALSSTEPALEAEDPPSKAPDALGRGNRSKRPTQGRDPSDYLGHNAKKGMIEIEESRTATKPPPKKVVKLEFGSREDPAPSARQPVSSSKGNPRKNVGKSTKPAATKMVQANAKGAKPKVKSAKAEPIINLVSSSPAPDASRDTDKQPTKKANPLPRRRNQQSKGSEKDGALASETTHQAAVGVYVKQEPSREEGMAALRVARARIAQGEFSIPLLSTG